MLFSKESEMEGVMPAARFDLAASGSRGQHRRHVRYPSLLAEYQAAYAELLL